MKFLVFIRIYLIYRENIRKHIWTRWKCQKSLIIKNFIFFNIYLIIKYYTLKFYNIIKIYYYKFGSL